MWVVDVVRSSLRPLFKQRWKQAKNLLTPLPLQRPSAGNVGQPTPAAFRPTAEVLTHSCRGPVNRSCSRWDKREGPIHFRRTAALKVAPHIDPDFRIELGDHPHTPVHESVQYICGSVCRRLGVTGMDVGFRVSATKQLVITGLKGSPRA